MLVGGGAVRDPNVTFERKVVGEGRKEEKISNKQCDGRVWGGEIVRRCKLKVIPKQTIPFFFFSSLSLNCFSQSYLVVVRDDNYHNQSSSSHQKKFKK
jgi:hypothetical protein